MIFADKTAIIEVHRSKYTKSSEFNMVLTEEQVRNKNTLPMITVTIFLKAVKNLMDTKTEPMKHILMK